MVDIRNSGKTSTNSVTVGTLAMASCNNIKLIEQLGINDIRRGKYNLYVMLYLLVTEFVSFFIIIH